MPDGRIHGYFGAITSGAALASALAVGATTIASTSGGTRTHTDTVVPNGICFHIPLKATMTAQGRDMNLSTVRRVRQVLAGRALARTACI